MMRLPRLLLPLAVLALFAVLGGCAAPQFQTNVSLIPPSDDQGRACVQNCEAKKILCQDACQNRYQSCAKALEPQVDTRYAEALAQFENDLDQYAAALRAYEMQLNFAWINSYPYGWGMWGGPWMGPWMGPWPGVYFPPPYPVPKVPTRDSVRAQLEKSNCQADCGCLPAYDGCFVGCGGQRLSETVCIKNCPPPK
jgi:hypothetical protein